MLTPRSLAKISIIIPVFNGEARVAAAIDSVLAQRFEGDVEIIVVNDGSSDDTSGVVKRFGERVRLVEQENRGLAGARNSGVRVSSGDYITFLDDDDIWMPEKLAKMMAILVHEPECAMAYSDALVVDPSGRQTGERYVPIDQRRAPSLTDLLSRAWNILPSSIVIPRSIFERCGGFCEQIRGGCCEDTYFYLRVREQGCFEYIDEPLLLYRHASVAENLAKRASWPRQRILDRHSALVSNEDQLIRLLKERYGRRAGGLIRDIRCKQVGVLVGFGLQCMRGRDRIGALRSYLKALTYDPSNVKLLARVFWSALPETIAAALSTILPRRAVRALAEGDH